MCGCCQKGAPWKNLKEFAEEAKKNPGKYVFAAPTSTSWLTFAMRNWFSTSGVELKSVVYKSGGEAATAVLGGHADMTFLFPQNYSSMTSAGELKILALGAKSKDYPDAPTFEELGYPGNYFGWGGISAPKGLPKEIHDKLAALSKEIVQDPDYIKAINNMKADPNFATGEEWLNQLKDQYAEMQKVLSSLELTK